MSEFGDVPGSKVDPRQVVNMAAERNAVFAEWKTRLDARTSEARARREQLTERLRDAQASGQSRDGLATAEVSAGGRLLGLELSPSARNQPPERIVAAVMAAYRSAASAAGRRNVEILAETVGPEQADLARRLLPDLDVEDD